MRMWRVATLALAMTSSRMIFKTRELLDKVKSWEDSELSGQQVGERPTLSPPKNRKQLTPLTAGSGPAQLLRAQLEEARKENEQLKRR